MTFASLGLGGGGVLKNLTNLTNPRISLSATATALSSAYLVLRHVQNRKLTKRLLKERPERLIVITGCDSGLGFSMAVWAASLGYSVLAGCLHEHGEGAEKLRREFPDRVFVAPVNVTSAQSLQLFLQRCNEVLHMHHGRLRLWALIANAAVATIGEFFWQTQAQREHQLNVNFWGTLNFITMFKSVLLQSKARVLVVSSDCSDYPLPFLGTYCASKAALNAWLKSFRVEVAKYGVKVVAYHPRDFSTKSGLFSSLEAQYHEMASEMTEFDKEFYGDYFDAFMRKKMEVFGCTGDKDDAGEFAVLPDKVGQQKGGRIGQVGGGRGHRRKSSSGSRGDANVNVKASNNEPRPAQLLDSEQHKKSFVHLLESDIRGIAVYSDASVLENIFHQLYNWLPQRCVDKMITLLLNPDLQTIKWKESNSNSISFSN